MMDLALDIIVEPDRSSWRWKDMDEFEMFRRRGLIDEATAERVLSEAEQVIGRVEADAPPFNSDGPEWRPDPSWATPRATRRLEAGFVRAVTDRPSHERAYNAILGQTTVIRVALGDGELVLWDARSPNGQNRRLTVGRDVAHYRLGPVNVRVAVAQVILHVVDFQAHRAVHDQVEFDGASMKMPLVG